MKKERQIQYDRAYMGCAESVAKLSYAVRNKVGCIIVSEKGQIISQGFNGTPAGANNRCEDVYDCEGNKMELNDEQFDIIARQGTYRPLGAKLVTKDTVLHAESNAISKCAKWISSTDNGTIYVTLSPCVNCAKLIIQAGIKRVCYKEIYRDASGIDFLKENCVEVEQIN